MFRKQIRRIIAEEIEKQRHQFGAVQTLSLHDGDIVVFMHPWSLSKEAARRIHDSLNEILQKTGKDVSGIVLEEGASLEILRPTDEHDATIEAPMSTSI